MANALLATGSAIEAEGLSFQSFFYFSLESSHSPPILLRLNHSGLYRSCLSKLRAAKPLTAHTQRTLLLVCHDYSRLLAALKWNNRSREAEGQTLVADETAKAQKRFPELDTAVPTQLPLWLLEKYR
jgi:hypothetical protein